MEDCLEMEKVTAVDVLLLHFCSAKQLVSRKEEYKSDSINLNLFGIFLNGHRALIILNDAQIVK